MKAREAAQAAEGSEISVQTAGGIIVAAVAWFFAFGVGSGNFWVKIGVAVAAVTTYSLLWQKPRVRFTPASVLTGLASAVVLYSLFFAGNVLAPYVVPGASSQVGGIYGLGEGSSRLWIFLLLFFVTGPGEEIFWRGFLQDRLEKRLGVVPGYVVAALVYGGVHVFSGNVMLVLAALVAGGFWGLMYVWKHDIAALIVSHSLWSSFIFAVAPIR
ncbi:MAG: lysostaphin resistance A-like protein [Vicinamibacterales bacterium]